MKTSFLSALAMLVIVPCALAQDAPPPPAGAPAPPSHSHHNDRQGPGDPGGPQGPGGRQGGHDMHGDMGGPGDHMMGMWWKSPEVAKRIGLTTDQSRKIDDLFLQSRVQLIHLHATLEEQELMLRPLMDANPVDQGKALAQIGKIADTRAELEKTNAKMLLSIRAVLTADQWTKLQARNDGPHGGGQGRGAGHGPQDGKSGKQGPPPAGE